MKHFVLIALAALALSGCGEKAATPQENPEASAELVGVIQNDPVRIYVFYDRTARNTCYTTVLGGHSSYSGIALSCVAGAGRASTP